MIVSGLVNPKHVILAYRKYQFQKEIQTKIVWCMCPRFAFAHIYIYIYIVTPRYNAVVRVHDIRPRCKRGALGVPISAIRELLNNSDRCPLHQVHERCRSPMCLQHCPIRQHVISPKCYVGIAY